MVASHSFCRVCKRAGMLEWVGGRGGAEGAEGTANLAQTICRPCEEPSSPVFTVMRSSSVKVSPVTGSFPSLSLCSKSVL